MTTGRMPGLTSLMMMMMMVMMMASVRSQSISVDTDVQMMNRKPFILKSGELYRCELIS